MKKKIPKKITLDNLEKSAIKYLEKYSVSEFQFSNNLKRKIIKSSFFYKTDPNKHFELIKILAEKFKKAGIINDKKFSDNKALIYLERGYPKKKIIFNLKSKGICDEDIKNAIDNLNNSYFDCELASALIYARKKKFFNFKEKIDDFKENKKKLLQMSQAGFPYDIAKKIINLKDEKEFFNLEEYAKFGDD